MDGDDWHGATLPQHARHEHGSDDESSLDDSILEDEERAVRHVRHRSYSDNDGSGSGDNLHFRSTRIRHTLSSDHDSDSPLYSRNNNNIARNGRQELHHRHPAVVRTHSGEFVGSSTPPRGGAHGHGKAARSQPKRTGLGRRRAWTVWLRLSVVSGVVGYFVLVILGSQILQTTDPAVDYPLLHQHAQVGHGYRGATHIKRDLLDRERLGLKKETTQRLSDRATRRRARTTPPARAASISPLSRREPAQWTWSVTTDVRQQQQQQTPANLEDLCGIHARNASLVNPRSYLARDALNEKSRVLITGILNPIGFHLALTLQKRCGVQVMFGMDPMYPNTVRHRMSLLTRMRLLVSHIPKLVQPIVLPLIGLDPRLNKSKRAQPATLSTTGELNLLNFDPTHIVHLASYSSEEYVNRREPKFHNRQSPYVSDDRQAPLYRIRSSLVAMEQILASMSSISEHDGLGDAEDGDRQRPHFVYASALSSQPDPIHRFTKTADELLADTYHALYGTYAVGFRLPEIVYGPWGRPGTALFELAQSAMARWNETESVGGRQLLEDAGLANWTDSNHGMVFVDDAVEAIIASMQYRSKGSSPIVFEMNAPSKHTLASAASAIESYLPSSEATLDVVPTGVAPSDSDAFAQMTHKELAWTPMTTLGDGLAKTLAWHLDEQHPHGDPSNTTETGDTLLARKKVPVCATDDIVCNAGRTVLPCVSECSNKEKCASSLFDPIADLIDEVTKECDIVLYTQSLGYNVRDLSLSAKYMEEGKQMICNFAFVPRESELVASVIRKVPENQLKKFGISTTGASPSVMMQRRLEGLNGRLLYKGWILMWVPSSTTPLPTGDRFLLKLSPGKLFSSDPKYALYIDEKFPVSPNIDDVHFLIGQTHRAPFHGRSLYRRGEKGEKHKYKLAPEPERRAAILIAPLKRRTESDDKEHSLTDTKLSVYEATKYMRFEIGENAATQKESSFVKKQREFYERIQTFTNRQDMRSNLEPWYRYEMKHWIRSRWIVHDLKLEESRQLRCDWYAEHVPWGTDLDQLSFAHVMARRELERRVVQREPDDHVKPAHDLHPILKEISDAHEWHPMIGHLPSDFDAIVKVPQHMIEEDEHEHEGEDDPVATDAPKHKDVPLFVRIMSEHVMLITRRAWQDRQGSKTKGKRYKKKKKKNKK